MASNNVVPGRTTPQATQEFTRMAQRSTNRIQLEALLEHLFAYTCKASDLADLDGDQGLSNDLSAIAFEFHFMHVDSVSGKKVRCIGGPLTLPDRLGERSREYRNSTVQ